MKKDYFAGISFWHGYTGNIGNNPIKPRLRASYEWEEGVTNLDDKNGYAGYKTGEGIFSVTTVTNKNNQMVTLNPRESAMLPAVTTVTNQNQGLVYEYQERAAIHEYDGKIPRPEAERLAYHEMLALFIRQNHQNILIEFEQQINWG